MAMADPSPYRPTPLLDLPTSAYEFLPEPESPEDNPTFISRALDACLQSYLEYASDRRKKGFGLTAREVLHLLNHVKAAGRFQSKIEHDGASEKGIPIVYSYVPLAEQMNYKGNTKHQTYPRYLIYHRMGMKYGVETGKWDLFLRRSMVAEPRYRLQQPNGQRNSVEIYLVLEREAPKKSELVSIGLWDHNPEWDKGLAPEDRI